MPRRRASRTLDPTRLAQVASRPGADTRTWCALGVVEEIAYSAEDGFVLACRIVQGALAGEVVACELAHTLAPAEVLMAAPFVNGELAVMLVPEGDANTMPIVVGFLRTADKPAAAAVNGRTIDLALLSGTYVVADPERGAELELGPVRVVAPAIKLGPMPDPEQPFVRGKAAASAFGAFAGAVQGFCTTMSSSAVGAAAKCTGPLAGLADFFTTLGTELAKLGTEAGKLKGRLVVGDVLSKTIQGD